MRQARVRTRDAAAGAVGAATLLVLGVVAAFAQAGALGRGSEARRLIAENDALRARLDRAEGDLDDVSALVQRVRVYDDHIRDLAARGVVGGFGPLDPDEQAAHQAWIDRVVPSPPAAAAAPADPVTRADAVVTEVDGLRAELEGLRVVLDGMAARLAEAEAMHDVLPLVWPLEQADLTSEWGWRRSPYHRDWRFHAGVDLGAPSGTPILATNAGIVAWAGLENGYGWMIDLDHGGGVITRYAHASRLLVETGDSVAAGEMIALVGNSGTSTGPHLHYELRFDGESVDPLEYLP